MSDLNPNKAFIFRIVHRNNLPWIVSNGLHCRNSTVFDPRYVNIGNSDLISKRNFHPVPISPGGVLSDYVPFYFTPYSPMMLNIKTGYGGVTKRNNDEIIILVSSIYDLVTNKRKFMFTDRHAYLQAAQYYSAISDLDKVDWPLLQSKNFRKDADDPGKFERYQAEALVHNFLPCESLKGAACYNQAGKASVDALFAAAGKSLKVVVKPNWYF
ncbi:DUF4433 domain-containing protein [Beijerinckia sp. L45]|uniref:type II toxin-antitoxin system toxin DNA ADP-ribosyl transferase DarT n=1 Tax=Beijerinckia sp. L45 TaxID=1641855 RepID=UPI00131EA292|nr:DUF4433 domain-containing protein [Beijerinckia sp. L45]